MAMILRDYQDEAINSTFNYFIEGNTGNPLIAMPTGTGKSLVIAGFLKRVFQLYPNQRILCLTHVKELIEQNHSKLSEYWPGAPSGIYSAGLNKRDVYNNIIFGGIASVNKKAAIFGHVDLVIIDEAHLLSPNQGTMYNKFIDELRENNPYLKVIGLTATPYRLGQGMLTDEGGLFTDTCFDITGMEAFNRLIAEGYLAPLIPKRTTVALEVDGVHMRGGEFVQKELQNAVDKHEVTYAALKESIEIGCDRRSWLIFASGVEHAIHISDMLNSLDIPSAAVHGGNSEYKMSPRQRSQAIADFKSGKLRALVNNNVLTTGFDHPPIDFIICLRPTASPGLWVQMLGRGTRPVYASSFDLTTTDGRLAAINEGGKHNCLVMDFAGNTRRLGPINDPVVPRRKGKKGGEAPIKECERCNVLNHASVRFCINCGYEFHFQTKLKMAASTEEIIKGDLPVVEEFKVDHITYTPHSKPGRPTSLKVSYHCGYKLFSEFVCIEHDNFPRRKAVRWWQERSAEEVPKSVIEAVNKLQSLKAATSIRVWTNKKYPEILAHCYNGTHFNTEEPVENSPTTSLGHSTKRRNTR